MQKKPTEVGLAFLVSLALSAHLFRACIPSSSPAGVMRNEHLSCMRVGGVVEVQAMRLAVRGMLPRNKLRDRLMKQRLLLYEVRYPAMPPPLAAR